MEAEADRISMIKESEKREGEAREVEVDARRILGRQGRHLAGEVRVQAALSRLISLQLPETPPYRSAYGSCNTYSDNSATGSPTVAELEQALRNHTIHLVDGTRINGIENRERELAAAELARQAWRDSKMARFDTS